VNRRYGAISLLAALLMLLMSSTATAHHPMGGAAPSTHLQGLLSGLAHPIIGADHFAFIVGVGFVLALGLARGLVFPIALVGAAVMGTVLSWLGATVPLVEIIVALTLFGLAATVLFGLERQALIPLGVIAAAFFHGQAYAGAVIGSELSPLVTYLIGFTVIQIVIASTVYLLARWVLSRRPYDIPRLRAGGGAAIGTVGAIYMSVAVVL